MHDPYVEKAHQRALEQATAERLKRAMRADTRATLDFWGIEFWGAQEQPMREHIHVPADYEDHSHQPAWNEPSRNAGSTED